MSSPQAFIDEPCSGCDATPLALSRWTYTVMRDPDAAMMGVPEGRVRISLYRCPKLHANVRWSWQEPAPPEASTDEPTSTQRVGRWLVHLFTAS